MPPTAMMVAVMVMHGNEYREATADADYGHGKYEGGKNPFHGISKSSDTLE